MNVSDLYMICMTFLWILLLILIIFSTDVGQALVVTITNYITVIMMMVFLGIFAFTNLIVNPAGVKTTFVIYSVVAMVLGIINICETFINQKYDKEDENTICGISGLIIGMGISFIFIAVSNIFSTLAQPLT